ncbi:uncharacterized protein LOC110113597 [Dendrobium catenatum]|uniref:uncharacterized protein LOC110113597 n=1 Tax=Dendrobium catenatum TaxID=906689 RepID=UPI0009F2A793|nr:uncharacterized protein LOC110113597 [Dendrobium catenatum]
MNLLVFWNCRGAKKVEAALHLKEVIKDHKVFFVGLMETKLNSLENSQILKFLGNNCESFLVPSEGLCGGLMVLWRKDLLSFTMVEVSSQMILGKLEVFTIGIWKVTTVYANTNAIDRKLLWESLEKHCSKDLPTVIGGDFNCVLCQDEKRGGKKNFLSQGAKDLKNFMINNDLHEVGYMGPKFTWCNNKFGGAQILEKLDRCLIHSTVLNSIHLALVKHLSRIASDLCPILLEIFNPMAVYSREIRYEEVLATYHGAEAIVQKSWSKYAGIDPASSLNVEIQEIQLEEVEAIISFEKLQILRFKINELNVTLARLIPGGRKELKQNGWKKHRQCMLDGWPEPSTAINEIDQSFMDADFTREEVQVIVEKSGRNTSPGLDGISFSFIKIFWKWIADDVWLAVSPFLSAGDMHQSWKETLIVLIPNIQNPQAVSNYRPISLCMTIYKIIAKMLLSRLEKVIHKIISVDQGAFIKGPSLSDDVLLAQEVFIKFWYSKAKKGLLAIKLDMEQACDSMG